MSGIGAESVSNRADGVFSGGGIKGLAFAGAIKAAEEAGYNDWQSLGGTSAGAITAMALAVGYDADGLKELFSFDFSRIDDRGGPFGLGVVENYFHHGIVHGKALSDWIESVLEGSPDHAGGRAPKVFGDLTRTLKVVGTDIVHERMVVFPDDAGLYLDEQSGEPYTPGEFPDRDSGADQRRLSPGSFRRSRSTTLRPAHQARSSTAASPPRFRCSCSTTPTRDGPPGLSGCSAGCRPNSHPTTRSRACSGRSTWSRM